MHGGTADGPGPLRVSVQSEQERDVLTAVAICAGDSRTAQSGICWPFPASPSSHMVLPPSPYRRPSLIRNRHHLSARQLFHLFPPVYLFQVCSYSSTALSSFRASTYTAVLNAVHVHMATSRQRRLLPLRNPPLRGYIMVFDFGRALIHLAPPRFHRNGFDDFGCFCRRIHQGTRSGVHIVFTDRSSDCLTEPVLSQCGRTTLQNGHHRYTHVDGLQSSACVVLTKADVLALLLWHYVLTVEKEFAFFWRRRFSGVCALFLANRYLILVVIVNQSPWWNVRCSHRVSLSVSVLTSLH